MRVSSSFAFAVGCSGAFWCSVPSDGTFLRLPMGILLFIESFFVRRILGAAGGAETVCCAGSLLR